MPIDADGVGPAPARVPAARLDSFDIAKGLVIFMVLQAHATFWSGQDYLPDWTRQWSIVLDVTLLPFISGFLLAGGGPSKITDRIWRQGRRIFAEYYVLAGVALAIAAASRFAVHRDFMVAEFGRALLSLLVVYPVGQYWNLWNVLGGSLWFLRAYLECLPILLLVLRFRPGLAAPVALLATLVALAATGTTMGYGHAIHTDSIRVTLGFLLYALLGATLRIHLWHKWNCSWTGAVFVVWIIGTGILVAQAGFPEFAYAKFPPSWTYLVFHIWSVILLCLFAHIERTAGLRWIPAGIRGVLSWSGRNIFTIYLIQGLTTSLSCKFLSHTAWPHTSAPILYLINISWNFVSSLLLTFLVVQPQDARRVPSILRDQLLRLTK